MCTHCYALVNVTIVVRPEYRVRPGTRGRSPNEAERRAYYRHRKQVQRANARRARLTAVA
jgi:hypothetical protein